MSRRAAQAVNRMVYEAAKLIRQSSCTVAFTGAGISVESGIPPFRGRGGCGSDMIRKSSNRPFGGMIPHRTVRPGGKAYE